MKRNLKNVRLVCRFTLVELLVSMGVFTLLMFVLIRFFDSAQKAWTLSSQRNMVYENARIALDLITRDLQCALYNDENSVKGIYPFWHENTNKINFITATSIKSSNATSKICEVKYARSDGTLYRDDINGNGLIGAGWLVRSVTGDDSVDGIDPNDKTDVDNRYNFHLFPRSDGDTKRAYRIWKGITDGANPSSGKTTELTSGFQEVVPYVVSITFTCYNKAGQDMVSAGDYSYSSLTTAPVTYFPYSVKVDLTLLDKISWDKWVELDSHPDADPSDDSTHAWGSGTLEDFRKQNERTFSKTIFLGERASN